MNLKQLIFIIPLILLRKHRQCYASNQTNSAGNLLNAGIFNCSYDNTINITRNAVLANGSYIYNNQTVVPNQLVGNYDYEIFYNGTRRKVAQHKRACICHLKPCISMCSDVILETYQYVINNDIYDALDIFSIDMTLANNSVVTKNIAEDFAAIVLTEYCKLSYMLSPETHANSGWTLFEVRGNCEIYCCCKFNVIFIFRMVVYCVTGMGFNLEGPNTVSICMRQQLIIISMI